MTPQQPQAAPPLVPVGGEIVLLGHRFQVIGHSVDKNGNAIEIPGKHLGPAPRAPKQNKRAGQAAVASTPPMAHAPSAQSSPLLTPLTRDALYLKKARKSKPHQRYQPPPQKPRPLVIINEPWTAGQWFALIVVLGLVVAAIFFSNAGAEQRKWEQIEGAAGVNRGR